MKRVIRKMKSQSSSESSEYVAEKEEEQDSEEESEYDMSSEADIEKFRRKPSKPKPNIKLSKITKTSKSKETKKKPVATPISIEIAQDSRSFTHTRPSFLARWDGESNEIDITDKELKDITPGMRVYWEYKSKNMNAMVFVQMGKVEWYAFETDALRLSEMTGKNVGKFSKYLMVHLWEKEFENLKERLYQQKIPVHIMMEIEDEQYKNTFKINRREVTEVINPAVNVSYTPQQPSVVERYLLVIYKSTNPLLFNCVAVDCESNHFDLEQTPYEEFTRILNKYKPVEIVAVKSQLKPEDKKMIKQICGKAYMKDITYLENESTIEDKLQNFRQFSPGNESFFKNTIRNPRNTAEENKKWDLLVHALDVTFKYFQSLGLIQKIFANAVFSQNPLNPMVTKAHKCVYDAQVYENMDIFEIKGDEDSFGKSGTLYQYVNYCETTAGKHKLRKWLDSPLTNLNHIVERQLAIKELLNNYDQIKKLHKQFTRFPDLESKITRVYHWFMDKHITFGRKDKEYNPANNMAIVRIRQLKQVLQALEDFQKVLMKIQRVHLRNDYLNELLTIKGQPGSTDRSMPDVSNLSQQIFENIVFENNGANIRPKPGMNEAYDNQMALVKSIYQELDRQLEYWKDKLKCQKLNYVSARSRNEIEMPKSVETASFKDLVFSSTTAKFDRYTTMNSQSLTANLIEHEELMDREVYPLLNELILKFIEQKHTWYKVCDTLSEIDVLISLTHAAYNMPADKCLPTFSSASGFGYIKGRHPGLLSIAEKKHGKGESSETQEEQRKSNTRTSAKKGADFVVPNSLHFEGPQRVLLITGPNMGGKSTLLRQTCLYAILAQIGSYVPAKAFMTRIFDQIFCRIGAEDRLLEGKSTFFVELEETKRILDKATKNSLVVIDELGRGTSTFDGLSIAYGTLQYIVETIKCYCLFSTHYSLLADQFTLCAEVRNKVMEAILEGNNRLRFTYQLIDGVAQRSFSENVARMVRIPDKVIGIAAEKADMITKESKTLREMQVVTNKFNKLLVDVGII